MFEGDEERAGEAEGGSVPLADPERGVALSARLCSACTILSISVLKLAINSSLRFVSSSLIIPRTISFCPPPSSICVLSLVSLLSLSRLEENQRFLSFSSQPDK